MGAPVGNQNAAKAKQWASAIERALEARGAGDRLAALNALAAKLLDKAEEGDMAALKELGDRLDGKPSQSIDANVSGNLTAILETLPIARARANPAVD